MESGPIHWLRQLGRRVLPQGPLRSRANALLLAIERRRGTTYNIAGRRLRFAPGSIPGRPNEPSDTDLDALQLQRFAEALHEGDVVADVGAYRGVYSAVAAAVVGARGHVYAFEPVAANIEIMLRNLALNGLTSRVTIIPRAAAAQRGSVPFYEAGSSAANSMLRAAIEPLAAGSMRTTTVETCTLDDELLPRGVLPAVVKIDVEGAEFAVLRGADAIARSAAQFFCELHPYAWDEAGHTGEELRTWLAERGRTIRDLESDAEIMGWRYGPVRF